MFWRMGLELSLVWSCGRVVVVWYVLRATSSWPPPYVRGRGGSHSPPVREGGDVFCFLVWCPVGVAPSRYGFVDEVLIEMSDARLITYARCMCSYVAPAS